MPIEFPTLNFAALAPILAVLGTAALVMICDLIFKDKRLLGYLSLLGLIIAAAPCFLMLMEAPPAPSFQNMAVSDGYSLVLDLIFIVTAALSVLVSLSYLDHKNMQRGEYYALLLFATSGMMLMGAATDLIIVFMGLEVMSIALTFWSLSTEKLLRRAGMKYLCSALLLRPFIGAMIIYGDRTTKFQRRLVSPERVGIYESLPWLASGAAAGRFSFESRCCVFQWWTPDVHHGAPTSVTAFMSVEPVAGFAAPRSGC